MLTIITQTYTWPTTITTTTTAVTTTKTRKKYPTKNTDEKKFTFNIPLEKRESRELLERKKERKKDKKKILHFPFIPRTTFHFGGTSVVFLPDSHFARQQYTRVPAASTRFFHESTHGVRGGGCFLFPSSPIYSPTIRCHTTRRGGEGKNVFFENDSR